MEAAPANEVSHTLTHTRHLQCVGRQRAGLPEGVFLFTSSRFQTDSACLASLMRRAGFSRLCSALPCLIAQRHWRPVPVTGSRYWLKGSGYNRRVRET